MTNAELVDFALDKLGVPYVMGTNGRILAKSMYEDLVKRNPANWFTGARKLAVKNLIGKVTTDCHGLIEWAHREIDGANKDTSADNAYNLATIKGDVKSIPEIAGVCVRYKGHVGIYIGDGIVIEARGFNYGVVTTELKNRPWTHWYKHPWVQYKDGENAVNMVTKGMSTEQIQSVLNKGGCIKFEKATYDITKTLKIFGWSDINLNGATIRQGGKINHIFLTDSDGDVTEYNGVCNVEIYGGTIEGMGKYKTKLNLITLCHSRNIYIHDMILRDVVEFHDIEINSSENVIVENCTFEGFNSSLDDSDFRECIQIDSAEEAALVVVPLGTAWYDGTACKNITIRKNTFKASNSRPAPSQCIGNHCQPQGKHYENIIIEDNIFIGGNQTNPNGVCINLVATENAKVRGNRITGYGRGIQVTAYDKSYNLKGNKISATDGDGISKNVLIANNRIENPTSTYKSSGIFVTSKNGYHENIRIEDNTIVQSGVMVNAIDVNYVDTGHITGTDSKANVKIGQTCRNVV